MKKLALTFGIMLLCVGLASAQVLADVPGTPNKGPKADEAFFMPPVVSNFDTKADFEDYWLTVDKDGDDWSWIYDYHEQWPALDGSLEGGCLRSGYNASRNADDWLITRKPVKLSKGKAYIAFVYASGHRDPKELERLAVYCGTDADPDELLKHEIAAPWTFFGREWKLKVIEVDITADGEYYFGLRACSDANRLNIYVDEIEIGQGDYKGVPNLSLDYLYLPISSCNLGQSEIGLRLINRGKTDIESFELTYQVGEGAPVTEQFTTPIGALDTIKVAFAQQADLSADGLYTVHVEGKVLTATSGMEEAAGMQRDNVITGQVTHFMETTLPFVTDMNKAEERAQWGFAPGTWSYDPTKVLAIRAEDTLPLISRCVPLQANHSYRFTFDYVGGIDVLGILGTEEDFDVLYGPAGTPVAGWNLIKRYENVQTENLLVRDEVVFTPTADGVYAFAIVSRREFGVLYIQTVSVTEIKEHDVVLQDWVTRLGRMTPARHAVKPSFEALVANRGKSDETGVKMILKNGDQEIGQSRTTATIRKDSLAVFRPINGEIPQPALNEEVTLRLSVEMDNEDGNPYDNAADFTFLATDTLYVFDACDADPESGVGSPLAIGNIFTLAEQDTLTAITVSWVDITTQYPSDFDVAVEIYPVDMTTGRVSNATMSYKVKRGLKGGFRTIELPAHIMPAGSYLIGLRQLGSENISVAVDGGSGYFFMTANGAYAIQGGKGFLGIRAVFGTVQSLKTKDIELLSIDSPKEVGAFTANQPIRVSYINNGFEAMEVEFKCTVNDKVLTSKRTVRGYESGRVSFATDMSVVGEYTITVEAIVAEDDDPDNNAVRKTVQCVVIDPRIMNFEYCDDFAVSGFTPAWKSVDLDGIKPGPHNSTFPNIDAPFGFMAYNPYLSGEVDPNTGTVDEPHGGVRCGMCMVTQPANNDWLISPEFSMASNADSLGVSLWVRSSDPVYKELYNVLVSTSGDKPGDFEVVPDENGAVLRAAPGEWTKVWVDLSQYAGKNIYVAIQCVSQNAWMFFVDDIEVKTGNLSNESSVDLSRYVKSYPNPVRDEWTVTAYDLQIRRVEICNMTGGVVFRSADNLSTEVYRVNMEGFVPGLYTARVYTNAGVQTLKVIVR